MDNETKERQPLIPVRILNEYVYCPRLAYMMWVQGEFAHSADTVEGAIRHKRVDKESGKLPVDPVEEPEEIHARSVALSSETLGVCGHSAGTIPRPRRWSTAPSAAAVH